MSKKDKKTQQHEPVEDIQEALSKTEQFIEKNQKILIYVLAGILGVILIYWGYMKYYKQPREQEAFSQMFLAERNFEVDSFAKALDGAEGYPGFLQIIEDYSGTKAANLAYFYAGMSYMYLSSYDSAIYLLNKFTTDDMILATEKFGAIGDAYVNKEDYQNAEKYYKKAVDDKYANNFTTPIFLKKLGLVYEKLGQKDKALEVYERIYNEYPQSQEARTIEKYIERVK